MGNYNDININTLIKEMNDAAKLYKEKLLNKNLMFIYVDKNGNYDFIETIFEKYNFLHFTGITYENLLHKNSANSFFDNCLKKLISPENIIIPKDKRNLVSLKLSILKSVMSISSFANSIGEYNGKSGEIGVEKVVGNTNIVLGLSNIDKYGNKLHYYFPRSLLKDSIYVNSNKNTSYNIVGVLSKNKNDKSYSEICRLKGIDINFLFNNQKIADHMDFSKIYSKSSTIQKSIKNFFNDFVIIEKENKKLYGNNININNGNTNIINKNNTTKDINNNIVNKSTDKIEVEELNDNISNLLDNVEINLKKINWELPENILQKKISEVETDNVEKFLKNNKNHINNYISKIVPDEFKDEIFKPEEILEIFLYNKIDKEFGTTEEILGNLFIEEDPEKEDDDEEEEI